MRSLCAFARVAQKIGTADLRSQASIDFLKTKALTAEDMAIIAGELKANTHLVELDLAGNGFGAAGAETVADIMRSCTSLQSLVLDNNNLRNGVVPISEALSGHTGMRSLKLAANAIGPSASQSVADAVAANTHLESLDVSSNAFGPTGGEALGEALSRSAGSSKLLHLKLVACGVRVSGAVRLAAALSGDDGADLSALDMTTNFIGPEGVAAFAQMLHCNSTLEELSLCDNNIGQLGDRTEGTCGTALGEAIEANTTLRVLDMRLNGLSDAAVARLVTAKQRSDGRRSTPLELRLA